MNASRNQQFPKKAYQVAETYGLGMPEAIYNMNMRGCGGGCATAQFVALTIVLVLGLIILAAGLVQSILSRDFALMLFFGIGVAGGGLVVRRNIIKIIEGRNTSIIRCKDGIALVKLTAIVAMRWEQIECIRDNVMRISGEADHEYIVYDSTGRTITFNILFEGYEELYSITKQKVLQNLFPKVLGDYEAGKPIVFGAITVSKMGITYGKKELSWDEYASINLNGDSITILHLQEPGRWSSVEPWASIHLSQIPNVFLLTALVNSMQEKRTASQVKVNASK